MTRGSLARRLLQRAAEQTRGARALAGARRAAARLAVAIADDLAGRLARAEAKGQRAREAQREGLECLRRRREACVR